MRDRRARWAWTTRAGVAILVALATIGVGTAQRVSGFQVRPAKVAKGKAGAPKGDPLKKGAPAGDPLADPKIIPPNANPVAGTFHYRFKFRAPDDGIALTANYFPSKLGIKAPVILMVHEKNQSSKDFEDPISDLKGQGLAEYMQAQGYAVMTFDLRGHGANIRGPVEAKDWKRMVDDLQAAYVFLVDRNNRGELNLSQLGVIGARRGGEPGRGLGEVARGGRLQRGAGHLRHRRRGARLARWATAKGCS